MKPIVRQFENEQGYVTVLVVLILALVTLLGVWSTSTSFVEQRLTSNDQCYKVGFYLSDSGVYAIPKLISLGFENSTPVNAGAGTDAGGITYNSENGSPDEFYEQIMGFNLYTGGEASASFALNSGNVVVDVTGRRAENVAGGGVEFGSGSEGIGKGSKGGTAILCRLSSQGRGCDSAVSNVVATYRKVLGIPGGL